MLNTAIVCHGAIDAVLLWHGAVDYLEILVTQL